MNIPLFFQPTLTFEEKTAAEVVLPEDPNSWPEEVMQELFKQVPFVSDFEPQVVMEKVDAERGFGFGHILVQNKTEIQQGASPESLDSAGVKQARIPVVIKDRKLFPLDTVLTTDSKVLPLTETRLRQAIFRPSAFDITGRSPGDHSLVGQLYPPFRQNYGFGGGGGAMVSAMGKDAAAWDRYDLVTNPNRGTKKASVLEAIAPTLYVSDCEDFFGQFNGNRELEAAYTKNAHVTLKSVGVILEASKKQASARPTFVPTVVQLRKEAEGYQLKTASHRFWDIESRNLSRPEALQLLGEKVVLAADLSGSATLATEATTEDVKPTEDDEFELISRSGLYKVQDEKGQFLTGLVLTNLVDTDGSSLPISVFTNGSAQAVQGDIAGVRMGELTTLPTGSAMGYGLFYSVMPNGKVKATVPMRLKGSAGMAGQPTNLSGETFDGRPVSLSQQDNLADLVGYGDQMLLPKSWKWLPLTGAEVHLQEDVEQMGKAAEALRVLHTVELRSGGDVFSISGLPVEKVASDERTFLSTDDTLFMLQGLGVSAKTAMAKMGEAAYASRPVTVPVSHVLLTPEEQMKTAFAQVQGDVEKLASLSLSLRKNLVKEAAVIPDPTAVDTILSLSFLNPENLGIFISYLPVLDEAQEKMCEILLGARLGLKEIPTSALERAVKALEEVIQGLRVLAFQQV